MRCNFITPQILEHMAQTNPEVRKSLLRSHEAREERSFTLSDLLSETQSSDHSNVIVWNCKNTYRQRLEKVENPLVSNDPIIKQAATYATFVRDFLINNYSRHGLDGKGTDIHINVHYGDAYLNAFWDGSSLTLGDGDEIVFSSFAKSIDVMAHEMGHGIVQAASGLIYTGESGALNEHFADVFGSIVQYAFKKRGKHDWLIGNEIMSKQLKGEALRSMAYPGEAYNNNILGEDPQPAHMNNMYRGTQDNGGVHTNSGIFNKVFYLVASEISIMSAGSLWYTVLHRLWPTAQFKDMSAVLLNEALRKAGSPQIPTGTPQIVRKALKEVGL